MAQQTLKDNRNNIIGYIDTDSNGKQVIKDSRNNIKGYYDPKSNRTYDNRNNQKGTGNLLTTLL